MAAPQNAKQNYLCDNILDQGYDPEDFMNFMAEAKEDGTNIDVWTMAELERVVQDYKQHFSSQNQEGQQNGQGQNEIQNATRENERNLQRNERELQEHSQISDQNINSYEVNDQNQANQDNYSSNNIDTFTLYQTATPASSNTNNNQTYKADPLNEFLEYSQQSQQKSGENILTQLPINPPVLVLCDPDFDLFFASVPNNSTIPVNNSIIQYQQQQQKKQSTMVGKTIQQNKEQFQQDIQNKSGQQVQQIIISKEEIAVIPEVTTTSTILNPSFPDQEKQISLYSIQKVQQKNVPSDIPQKRNLLTTNHNQVQQIPVIPQTDKFHFQKSCKKSVPTPISAKPEVFVTILNHEVASGSLFNLVGSSIVVYHVKTYPFNWLVKRKYTDFISLRSLLIKMYPGIPIPPLPEKTIKSLDDQLIQRRKGYFESFLAEVLSFPDLKSSKYLTDFLSIQDDKQFKLKVQAYQKLSKPKSIAEIETVSGKVELTKDLNCNAHAQNLANYFDQNDSNYEKLKKLSKQLMTSYNEVGNILHQMGEAFAALNSNVSAYNSKTSGSFQVRELEETYKIMNNMCVLQANSFSDQIKIFQNHFYNFFKFHKDNLSGLKEIVKTRNHLSSALAKKDSNEGNGLSGIFRSSKETVYYPAKILKELDEQVGYFNQQTLFSSKKILDNRYKTYSSHFKTYCCLQKSIITEMSAVWQEISDNFSKLLADEPDRFKIEIIKKIA